MTYDQWKTDSGYSEKTPEQENEGRDCPLCGGDCAAANPPVYNCPLKTGAWNGWPAHPDQTSPMTVGPEAFFDYEMESLRSRCLWAEKNAETFERQYRQVSLDHATAMAEISKLRDLVDAAKTEGAAEAYEDMARQHEEDAQEYNRRRDPGMANHQRKYAKSFRDKAAKVRSA